MKAIFERAALDAERQRQAVQRAIADTASLALSSVANAASSSKALVREITGQGPEKTLSRGFALVRSRDGQTISRAAQIQEGSQVELLFSDGQCQARI